MLGNVGENKGMFGNVGQGGMLKKIVNILCGQGWKIGR